MGFIVWPIKAYKERILDPLREFFGLPISYMPVMYHFDENSGNSIEDRSNHGNNGIAYDGNPNDGELDPPKWGFDKNKLLGASALVFGSGDVTTPNDDDDYIVINENPIYAEMLNKPKDGITIEFFIRVLEELDCDGNDNWRYVVSKGYPNSSYEVRLEEDYTISSRFKVKGIVYTIKSDPVSGNVGWRKWTHVAVTYENKTGTAKIFINGIQNKKIVFQPGEIDENTGELRIGGYNFGCPNGAGVPPAALDEFRIYNIPLPPEEIIFHYQGA